MASLVLGPLLRHVAPTTATVWVETDAAAEVGVLGHTAAPSRSRGTTTRWSSSAAWSPARGPVHAAPGRRAGWPPPGHEFPPSRIRTPSDDDEIRIVAGSCRYATPRAVGADDAIGADALDALARRLADVPEQSRPHLLLLLGDQVYADETTEETRRRSRLGATSRSGRGPRWRDFEEYTWLYHESWQDPEVRWLLSTVPTAMIFDDHDVHDDWNTSAVLAPRHAGARRGGPSGSSAPLSRTGSTSTSGTSPRGAGRGRRCTRRCCGCARRRRRAAPARFRPGGRRGERRAKGSAGRSGATSAAPGGRRRLALRPDARGRPRHARRAGLRLVRRAGHRRLRPPAHRDLAALAARPARSTTSRPGTSASPRDARGPRRGALRREVPRAADLEHWAAFATRSAGSSD